MKREKSKEDRDSTDSGAQSVASPKG